MKFEKLSYPEDWGLFSLQEVCSRITSGGTPSRKNEDFYKNGSVCWVKTKELENYYIYDTEEKITSDAIKNSSAKILPQNTILLAMYGATVGELGILSKDMACNQACCALIVNSDQFDYRYVFYLLKLHKKEIQSLATGAAQQNLSATVIRDFTFGFPILEKQKNIANILECLDKKIQLNTQTNQTLEAIAQAIFKSWFVDFDPVRAKVAALSEGKSEHEANLAAMSVICGKDISEMSDTEYQELWEIADAFPSELVENAEFGEVPKGWEVKSLDNIANYQNGLALQKFRPENNETFLPVVKIAQLRQGYADGEEKASADIKSECIIDNGDIIFSWSGTLMVDIWCGGKAALNQHLFKVTSNHYPKWFYYLWTKYHLAEFQRIAADKAVTMGHIKREHLSQALCIVPHTNFLQLVPSIEGFIEKIILNRLENFKLAQTRDLLLPKLLSGELLNE